MTDDSGSWGQVIWIRIHHLPFFVESDNISIRLAMTFSKGISRRVWYTAQLLLSSVFKMFINRSNNLFL